MPVWRLTINDRNVSYKRIKFERKLVIKQPTTFSATVKFDKNNPVRFMDVVKIYRDNVIQWKGYVDDINPVWGSDGHYLELSGKDATLILWKKYTDDFSNFAQKTAGFFGTVNPISLLKFLLVTPKSHIGIEYPFNKEGWGMDFGNVLGKAKSHVAPENKRKQQGHPTWITARQRGYGWFNSGKPEIADVITRPRTQFSSTGGWQTHGSIPYVDNTDWQTQNYTKYIECSGAGPTANIYMQPINMTNKQVLSATVSVRFKSKKQIMGLLGTSYGGFDLYVNLPSVGKKKIAARVFNRNNEYTTVTFPFNQHITNKNDLSSQDFYVQIEAGAMGWLNVGFYVAGVAVQVTTKTIGLGVQKNNDRIEIPFYKDGRIHQYTITALYLECRADPEAYPRNFTVEYSNDTTEEATNWSPIPNCSFTNYGVNQNNKVASDIILTFKPIACRHIRVRLTANAPNKPWGVSQIYVYLAEGYQYDNNITGQKYRAFLFEDEYDPSQSYPHRQIDSPDVYEYAGGPYIKGFEVLGNMTPNPIGPLNISRQRLLDAINYVAGLCTSVEVGENNTVAFQPMEWWLEYNDNNTFKIAERRGTEKPNIIFESGVNINNCNFKTWVYDTNQNVYVVGQGEQKKLEDTSLWIYSHQASGYASNKVPLNQAENHVRTFHEDIQIDKTIILDDNDYPAIAKYVGCANLTINAMPRIQLTFDVTKDTYSTGSYDVGDEVTVIDRINGIGPDGEVEYHNEYDLSKGKYRIQEISVSISAGSGESISLTLGYPNYKFWDNLQELYSKIKSYGMAGTFNSDWTAEGTNKKLLDARLISDQSTFTVNAENDKISQSIPYNGSAFDTTDYNITDAELTTLPNNISNRFLWTTDNTWFGMQSSTDNKERFLRVSLLGNLLGYRKINYENNTYEDVQAAESGNIDLTFNPKLTMDIKICSGEYSDLANSKWYHDPWVTDEYCRIGLATPEGAFGFWFCFVRNNSQSQQITPHLFDVYVQWSLPSVTLVNGTVLPELTNCAPSGINSSNSPYTGPDTHLTFDSPNGSYLTTICANQRYKISIEAECDPEFIRTQVPNVKFNLYEYREVTTTNNLQINITYKELTYPYMGIISDSRIAAMKVKPLYCELRNKPHPSSSTPPTIYFYNYSTNWTIKQIHRGSDN